MHCDVVKQALGVCHLLLLGQPNQLIDHLRRPSRRGQLRQFFNARLLLKSPRSLHVIHDSLGDRGPADHRLKASALTTATFWTIGRDDQMPYFAAAAMPPLEQLAMHHWACTNAVAHVEKQHDFAALPRSLTVLGHGAPATVGTVNSKAEGFPRQLSERSFAPGKS